MRALAEDAHQSPRISKLSEMGSSLLESPLCLRRLLVFNAGLQVNSTLPFSPGHIAGSCDDYLPSDSTFNRFLWNVHMLAANGMYVVIDNHSNFDKTIVTDYSAWLLVRHYPLLTCMRLCLHSALCATAAVMLDLRRTSRSP